MLLIFVSYTQAIDLSIISLLSGPTATLFFTVWRFFATIKYPLNIAIEGPNKRPFGTVYAIVLSTLVFQSFQHSSVNRGGNERGIRMERVGLEIKQDQATPVSGVQSRPRICHDFGATQIRVQGE